MYLRVYTIMLSYNQQGKIFLRGADYMVKVARSYRLSAETLRMIDEIVERFSSTLSKVTATQVIEEAVREFYYKVNSADERGNDK